MTDQFSHIFLEPYAACFADLRDLYIPGNLSGRVKFWQKWPEVARALFGDVLFEHDMEGTGDRALINAREDEAEAQRAVLCDTMTAFSDHAASVSEPDVSILLPVLSILGADVVALLYAPEICAALLDAPVSAPQEEEVLAVPDEPAPVDEVDWGEEESGDSYQDERQVVEAEPEPLPEAGVDAPPDAAVSRPDSLEVSALLKDGADMGMDLLTGFKKRIQDYTPVVAKAVSGSAKGLQEGIQSRKASIASGSEKVPNPSPRPDVPIPPPPLPSPAVRTQFSAPPQVPDVFLNPVQDGSNQPTSVRWDDFVGQLSSAEEVPEAEVDDFLLHDAVLYRSNEFEPTEAMRAPSEPSEPEAPSGPSPDTAGDPLKISEFDWSHSGGAGAADDAVGDGEVSEEHVSVSSSTPLGQTFMARPRGNNSGDED